MWCWESLGKPPDKLLVATLVPARGASIDWAVMFKNLKTPEPWDYVQLKGMPFGEARTHAALVALNQGSQWLFFLDSDVLVPPETILKFINYRVPIVSVVYPQRFPVWTGAEAVYQPCMFMEGRDGAGNETRVPVTDFQYGQILEVHYAPAGAMLIHRSVFERMLAGGIKRFFEWTMTADNPHGRSEDFDFCQKARSVGFKILVDTGVQAVHETEASISVRGVQVKI